MPFLSFGEGGNLRSYDPFCLENAVAPPTFLTSEAKWSTFTDGYSVMGNGIFAANFFIMTRYSTWLPNKLIHLQGII